MATSKSICGQLFKGLDINCIPFYNKYYQNIVLINRDDVEQFNIYSDENKHSITFKLKEGKTGFLFAAPENSSSLSASYSKSERDGIPYYTHKLQIPIVGVNENQKTLLKQLDRSNCFAAIHFKGGAVEIYGFNYKLKTSNYSYEAQSAIGGTSLNMESKYDEYDPPYIYVPKNIQVIDAEQQAIVDFNNLFANIPNIYTGDFNDDFNNDFYIE